MSTVMTILPIMMTIAADAEDDDDGDDDVQRAAAWHPLASHDTAQGGGAGALEILADLLITAQHGRVAVVAPVRRRGVCECVRRFVLCV